MTLAILSLEDEAEVRDALERDLAHLWKSIRLETADCVEDAWAAIADIEADGDILALVLSDHRLPGQSGVDFLVDLASREDYRLARTVLVTGQADQSDTIRALNDAGLDHYISKPWDPAKLSDVARTQLTTFVLEAKLDPLPYLPLLDAVRVMESIRG